MPARGNGRLQCGAYGSAPLVQLQAGAPATLGSASTFHAQGGDFFRNQLQGLEGLQQPGPWQRRHGAKAALGTGCAGWRRRWWETGWWWVVG